MTKGYVSDLEQGVYEAGAKRLRERIMERERDPARMATPMMFLNYQPWAEEVLGWYPELMWEMVPEFDGGLVRRPWKSLEHEAKLVFRGEMESPRSGSMPIPIEGRATRFGKVRLGRKVPKKTKDGRMIEMPEATDHFVVDDLPEVIELYGKEPRQMDIFFLWDDIHTTFPHFLKWYGGKRLKCLGDGTWVLLRSFNEFTDKETGNVVPAQSIKDGLDVATGEPVKCPWMLCPWYGMDGCRETGRLLFGFQKIPRLGFYEIVVHKLGVQAIKGQLEAAMAAFGQIVKMPWILRLVEMPVTFPTVDKKTGEPTEATRNVRVPQIEVDFEFMKKHLAARTFEAAEPFLLPEGQKIEALTSAAGLQREDTEDFEEERMDAEELAEAQAQTEDTEAALDDERREALGAEPETESKATDLSQITMRVGTSTTFWLAIETHLGYAPGNEKVKAVAKVGGFDLSLLGEKDADFWDSAYQYVKLHIDG